MWIWLFLMVLSVTGVYLLIKYRRIFFTQQLDNHKEAIKISKTFLIEHGEARWQVTYQVKENDTEQTTIETIPYCKNCNAPYRLTSHGKKALADLKCFLCGDIKIGYPLSENYRTVQYLAELKVKELKKHLQAL